VLAESAIIDRRYSEAKKPAEIGCQRAFDLIPLVLDYRNAYRHAIAWCEG
jgi:hypothetical protein